MRRTFKFKAEERRRRGKDGAGGVRVELDDGRAMANSNVSVKQRGGKEESRTRTGGLSLLQRNESSASSFLSSFLFSLKYFKNPSFCSFPFTIIYLINR